MNSTLSEVRSGSRGAVNPICLVLAGLLLLYYPNAPVFQDIFPLTILSYGGWATVLPTVLIVVLYSVVLMAAPRALLSREILLLAGALTIAVALRNVAGFENGTRESVSQGVTARFLLTIPISLAIAEYVTRSAKFRRFALGMIVLNGMVAALFSILYVIGVSKYRVAPLSGSDLDVYLQGAQTRATGLSGGPNVFSNFLLLPLIMAVFGMGRSLFVRLSVGAFLALGIVTSGSRWPVLAAAGLLTLGTARSGISAWKKIGAVGILGIAAVYSLGVLAPLWKGTSDRLTNRGFDDARFEKTLLGLGAVTNSLEHFVLGAEKQDLSVGMSGVEQFSDNGFLAMATLVGVPLSGFLLIVVYRGIRKRSRIPDAKAAQWFWIVVCGGMLLNNAIYWDSWILNAAVVYYILPLPGTEIARSSAGTRRIRELMNRAGAGRLPVAPGVPQVASNTRTELTNDVSRTALR